MRVIIIEDKDAKALLDKLKLESLRKNHINMRNPDQPLTMEDMHGVFLYVVVGWLNEQGAKLH